MPWFENRLGEKLWYEDAGCGVPLLFLHGWCMSSVVWKRQFGELADTFRLVAPDLRGHGKSRGASGQLDFVRFAADLADLINHLNLSRLVLVGWSMGAQIALQSYRQLHDRLAGLVLVSATPCFTARDDFPFGLPRKEAAGMHLKVERNIQRALEGFHGRMFADGEIEDQQEALQIKYLLDSVVPPDTTAAIDALDSLAGADMRPLLTDISAPVLILNGDRDIICLPQASDYLAKHIKSSCLRVFTGCGHAFFLTRAEQFNNEIIEYAGRVCDRNA
ncbi:MAG: alpha/beta fold hydrolase [Deltaproteobacteria bacterium]|nr:alpha/beta fold hydrolase [Deltaproteobacteria bacterium]